MQRNIQLIMELPQHPTCDFCDSTRLKDLYHIADSTIGSVVQVCLDCGLVQCRQTRHEPSEYFAVIDNEAAWEKGLSLDKSVDILSKVINWDNITNILIGGSSAGDFTKWVISNHPSAHITAIQPVPIDVDDHENLPGVDICGQQPENIDLPPNSINLVYLSHALEQALSASGMLQKIYNALSPGGYLYLEVLNLSMIDLEDIVEEVFTDQQRFYFDTACLCNYLHQLGFRIEAVEIHSDQYNISILATKIFPQPLASIREVPLTSETEWEQRFASYCRRKTENRERIRQVVDKLIYFIGRQRVAFWGAGRQFDNLVRYGDLDTSHVKLLVDDSLWERVKHIHGVIISRPEKLKIYQPQAIVVLAPDAESEIVERIRRLGIKNVIMLRDLMPKK